MRSRPSRSYCDNCEVHVEPVRHPVPWWLLESVAWVVALGTFLFIGTLAPVVLVLALVPMLCVACVVGPLHERTKAPPACPLCHRVLAQRPALTNAEAVVPALPTHAVRA